MNLEVLTTQLGRGNLPPPDPPPPVQVDAGAVTVSPPDGPAGPPRAPVPAQAELCTTQDGPANGQPTTADPQLPTVPGYEVLGELGRGGMGVVYWVWQSRLNRAAALKVLLADAHAGPEARARFRTEAEAVARLQHPNIVQVYDVGEQAGRPYLLLEYVPSPRADVRRRAVKSATCCDRPDRPLCGTPPSSGGRLVPPFFSKTSELLSPLWEPNPAKCSVGPRAPPGPSPGADLQEAAPGAQG
ncbi:MAG: protein kinase [Gemmataceae bacterium]|nr:protein kinase [Gemmataceae bacterium]